MLPCRYGRGLWMRTGCHTDRCGWPRLAGLSVARGAAAPLRSLHAPARLLAAMHRLAGMKGRRMLPTELVIATSIPLAARAR